MGAGDGVGMACATPRRPVVRPARVIDGTETLGSVRRSEGSECIRRPTPACDHGWVADEPDSTETAEESAAATPADKPVKVVRSKTVRDMVITTVVLIVAVLGFVAMYGDVSFAPGGSTGDAVTPTADVVGGFERADRLVGFTPAVPSDLPAGYQPSSFAITDPAKLGAGELQTVQGGWLTPDGTFVTLIQSKGDVAQVLNAQFGAAGAPEGQIEAGGHTWYVTRGLRDEMAWYRDAGDGVVQVITGSAGGAAFQAVAESIAP